MSDKAYDDAVAVARYELVRSKDVDGSTALHRAAERADFELARDVLAIGVDPNKKNHKGEMAIHLLLKSLYLDVRMLPCWINLLVSERHPLKENIRNYIAEVGRRFSIRFIRFLLAIEYDIAYSIGQYDESSFK